MPGDAHALAKLELQLAAKAAADLAWQEKELKDLLRLAQRLLQQGVAPASPLAARVRSEVEAATKHMDELRAKLGKCTEAAYTHWDQGKGAAAAGGSSPRAAGSGASRRTRRRAEQRRRGRGQGGDGQAAAAAAAADTAEAVTAPTSPSSCSPTRSRPEVSSAHPPARPPSSPSGPHQPEGEDEEMGEAAGGLPLQQKRQTQFKPHDRVAPQDAPDLAPAPTAAPARRQGDEPAGGGPQNKAMRVSVQEDVTAGRKGGLVRGFLTGWR